jgi:hypothetical protein
MSLKFFEELDTHVQITELIAEFEMQTFYTPKMVEALY